MNELQIQTLPLLIGGCYAVFAFVYLGVKVFTEELDKKLKEV